MKSFHTGLVRSRGSEPFGGYETNVGGGGVLAQPRERRDSLIVRGPAVDDEALVPDSVVARDIQEAESLNEYMNFCIAEPFE